MQHGANGDDASEGAIHGTSSKKESDDALGCSMEQMAMIEKNVASCYV
jgi:hypothetical protein